MSLRWFMESGLMGGMGIAFLQNVVLSPYRSASELACSPVQAEAGAMLQAEEGGCAWIACFSLPT